MQGTQSYGAPRKEKTPRARKRYRRWDETCPFSPNVTGLDLRRSYSRRYNLPGMYIPHFNRVDDHDRIVEFIKRHGFATLISNGEDRLTASHLPVLWDQTDSTWGALRSHMARANPQWKHFESGREVLCIFHGPHAYISPSWYVMQHTVPTWNYAAVHVYGIPKLMDDTALRQVVYDTTSKYESDMPRPWTIPLSKAETDQMLKAIVGFTIEIKRVEAKFKLGQNRSIEDQESMVRALQESHHPGSQELAKFILAQRTVEGL